MHRVERRVYGRDSEGKRFLMYRPGDVIDDEEAERVAALVGPNLERRDPAEERPYKGPHKPINELTLAELRAVCAAEGIDTTGGSTRAETLAILKAARSSYRLIPVER